MVIFFKNLKNTFGSDDKSKNLKLTSLLYLFSGFFSLTMSFLRIYFEGFLSTSWFMLFGISLFTLFISFYIKFKNVTPKKLIVLHTILLIFIIFYRSIVTGGGLSQASSWYFVILFLVTHTLKLKKSLYFSAFIFVLIWLAYLIPKLHIIEIVYQTNDLVNTIVLSFAFITAGLMASFYEKQRGILLSDGIKRLRNIESLEKSSLITTMISGISHEVKNPLSVIDLNLNYISKQIISIEDEKKDDLLKKLDKVRNHLKRIDIIFNELSVTLMYNTTSKEIINISSIVFDLEKEFNNEILFKKINITTSIKNDFLVYKNTFNKILKVMFINAIDFSNKNTKSWIDIKVFSDIDFNIIEFSDNGVGIKTEDIQRIFYPFYTTKEVGQGLGLGLSICKNIVESLGGTFALKEDSNNTSFLVKIPKEFNEPQSQL